MPSTSYPHARIVTLPGANCTRCWMRKWYGFPTVCVLLSSFVVWKEKPARRPVGCSAAQRALFRVDSRGLGKDSVSDLLTAGLRLLPCSVPHWVLTVSLLQ